MDRQSDQTAGRQQVYDPVHAQEERIELVGAEPEAGKQLLDEGRMDVSGISLLPADYRERAVHEGREEEWEVRPSPELEAELRKDHKIWLVYSDLSPGKRKEFNRWVFQAKRPETKRKRIERTVELIRMGRSLTEDMMQRTYKKKGGD